MSLDNKHHDNRKGENMYIARTNTILPDLTLTSLTNHRTRTYQITFQATIYQTSVPELSRGVQIPI